MEINTIFDLAGFLGIGGDIDADTANRRIAHSLFKYTECGISFYSDCSGVYLAGYCEGFDGDLPTYKLDYPFSGDDFEHFTEIADKDGCEMWEEIHNEI